MVLGDSTMPMMVGIGTNTPTSALQVNGTAAATSFSLPATANATTGVITLGGARFAHAFGSSNTFVGNNAGNFIMSGFENTASGAFALNANTTGFKNTGSGAFALNLNTTGAQNTASGEGALDFNTTGNNNTASGAFALLSNTTGNNNTAVGLQAGLTATSANANTTGSNNTFIGFNSGPGVPSASNLQNATAIGANAVVNCSNCMVLGDSTMPMNVGIGTNTPTSALHVNGTVTATSFSGSGASLTGISTLAASNTFTGQDIFTATPTGTGVGQGPVYINPATASTGVTLLGAAVGGTQKLLLDSGGNLSLSGSLSLPATANATTGVITLGGTPFAHAFGIPTLGVPFPNNTFLGLGAGNFNSTNTGISNTASGALALTSNTTGSANTASGALALQFNTTGIDNTAVGVNALNLNTTGSDNAAFGFNALKANTTAGSNAAFGALALSTNTTGTSNSAVGSGALLVNTTGFNNSAVGSFALAGNRTGAFNSAFGFNALAGLTGGFNNIAIGTSAGQNLTGSEGQNIYIGNPGVLGESNTIRIGGSQFVTFIAGISGATSALGTAVFVNSSGQLGTTTSSRRFKHAIADMGAESDLLMKLRPVAFYYKPEYDQTQTRQYGLVAEEVAQVAPQLVVYDEGGAPQTVRYHFVNALLLNEVQKQRRLAEEQRSTIARQQAEIEDLAARLARLEAKTRSH